MNLNAIRPIHRRMSMLVTAAHDVESYACIVYYYNVMKCILDSTC